MTGFRADVVWVAAVAAAFLTWLGPAAGQPAPQQSGAASGPPAVLGEAQPGPSPAHATPAASAGRAGAGAIQVRPLGSPDGPPLGLLDASNGGLGGDIWQDTPRSRVEDMLERLPLATAVASIRSLARRLVLTTADAPLGDAPHRFLSVRLKQLLNAGMLDDAGKLAAMVGTPSAPELARLVANSLLYAGRTADICSPATGLRLQSGDPYWIELRAYCYAVAGDENTLDLTRAVMRAQNIDDPAFETLLDDYLSHRTQAPGEIHQPTALHVFLLKSLGLPIDPAWSQSLGLPASVAAMRDPNDTPDRQLEAVEDVARSGAASPAELAAIADAQTFAPDQLAAAGSAAPTAPFVAGQALLRQAIGQAVDDDGRKRLVLEALRLADKAGLLPVAAGLQGDAAAAVQPDPSDRAHAALMASALMLSGHADAAARWYDALDLNADDDKPLISLLQAEIDLVTPNAARDADVQTALSWFAAQATAKTPIGGEPTRPLALLVLGTYDALGMPMPPQTAPALAVLKAHESPGRRPGAELFTRLAAATKDSRRRGDTVLSILDFIGPGGPGDVAPDATVAFVNALVKMGYADAAHDLAVDALLLYRPAPPPPSASAS